MEVTCLKQYDRVCALVALNEGHELNCIYNPAPIWHHEPSVQKQKWLGQHEREVQKAYKNKTREDEMVKIIHES